MILQFSNFLIESNFYDCSKKYGTFGRWVEKNTHNNEYLMSIISPFLIDVDPDIRISNAVDLLSEFDQKQIYAMITSHKERKVESTENDVQGGRNVFKSFLKAGYSMSIGKLEKKPNKDYIIFYESNSINDDILLQSFGRFRSLQLLYKKTIENQECRIFFGVDTNLNFVYGVTTVSARIILGSFRYTKSSFEWSKGLNLNLFSQFKMDIFELNWEDFQLLSKIHKFMLNYPLGDKTKLESIWSNYILTFSYYGVSKWDNGVMDMGEYENIKTNLKTRLSSESWSKRILLNVSADSFYLKISFKIK
jgi:hypothetical protein